MQRGFAFVQFVRYSALLASVPTAVIQLWQPCRWIVKSVLFLFVMCPSILAAQSESSTTSSAPFGEDLIAGFQRSRVVPVHASNRSHSPKGNEAQRRAEDLQRRATILEKGSSSRSERKATIARLPLQKLTPGNRQRAQNILNDIGIFRRLPTISFEVEPDVYEYFYAYPDVAVSIWRSLQISKFQMKQIEAERYVANDSEGTSGVIDVIHRGRGECLALCNGLYKSPLVAKPIRAMALLFLEVQLKNDAKGMPRAIHRVTMFVSFPSQTVETAARIVSPVSNMIVDRNFREVSLFLHMMSMAMARQPGWVDQLSRKLEDVTDVRKMQLIKLTARVYVNSQRRQGMPVNLPIRKTSQTGIIPNANATNLPMPTFTPAAGVARALEESAASFSQSRSAGSGVIRISDANKTP